METLYFSLKEMYDNVLVDALLGKDSREYAALLNPYVSLHFSGENKGTCLFSPKSDSPNSPALDFLSFKGDCKSGASENRSHSRYDAGEITLFQLTLVKMILTKARSQELETGTKQKYLEIVRILLKEAHIDSKLIHCVCSPDKQLSYLASKSLVSLVCFQLKEEHLLNSHWLAFSSEVLLGFPSSNWIAECLWILTNVIKEILKDEGLCKEGDLKKLLMPVDETLNGFYNTLMFYYSDITQDIPISAKATNDLSSFLDLLELLVASRIQMPLNLSCQRMLFLNASCVLGLATAPVHDFIKKKSIMLLKKCILHKAGEDLIKRKAPSSHQDLHINTDTSAFADAFLQFVNSGWLNRLTVSGKASHFGGSQVKPEVDICSSADQVTLRALSLVLLKALEIKIQDSAFEAEAKAHLESGMYPLLKFLERYLRPSLCVDLLEHPCIWLSVLFIEQDDDLFEASNALLSIHLKFQRFWSEVGFATCHLNGGPLDTWTHQNGCNPHCIFLFLLKSIAFDASVLLDFLISSETCFLEYFVRYLKLLAEDWHQFLKISILPKPTVSRDFGFPLSCQPKGPYDSHLQSTSCDPHSCTATLLTSSQNLPSSWHVVSQSVKPTRTNLLLESDNTPLLGPFQRLVDYESSEDSEAECVEECLTETKQPSLNNQTCTGETNFMEVDDRGETSKQNVLPLDHKDRNTTSTTCCQISPNTPEPTEEVLQKSVKCFQELEELISKLHKRNLFPYNPSALLKLLTRVVSQ
ncbi:protein Lines homolog 1 [Sceloporus undulatus]|uniref:protein Lines homolog 1 n=1 Tax=Sceloporus undulatus TaxID=8520 RepID=UPI001C4D0403|nr:protein Lines homolog 1 [Sceloporus undulatus]XP_042329506.1 protein Lines homolog 1 [Sceloporus undulatus]XP_042329507.1 protein Lines homolog 1 [Sceloporus undulatus]XP_042329508.1 protein Lines homolog 1 [Sceloporus undulatus]XP_042329509.1 protein Lines homolog 1 [Sceloporus undulatus]XP_042329511.1 protein Lines homolog 1 [Sceloporus undulatus]